MDILEQLLLEKRIDQITSKIDVIFSFDQSINIRKIMKYLKKYKIFENRYHNNITTKSIVLKFNRDKNSYLIS